MAESLTDTGAAQLMVDDATTIIQFYVDDKLVEFICQIAISPERLDAALHKNRARLTSEDWDFVVNMALACSANMNCLDSIFVCLKHGASDIELAIVASLVLNHNCKYIDDVEARTAQHHEIYRTLTAMNGGGISNFDEISYEVIDAPDGTLAGPGLYHEDDGDDEHFTCMLNGKRCNIYGDNPKMISSDADFIELLEPYDSKTIWRKLIDEQIITEAHPLWNKAINAR